MTNKEKVLNLLKEIQDHIPQSILDELMTERISESNIDNFMATYLSTFPPNYLPVLEKDGNLFGIHLEPGKTWQNCPWVMLPHDSQEIDTIASSFTYLPYAFFTSWMNGGHYVDEIISPVSSMLNKTLEKADRDFIKENIESDRRKIIAKYDKTEGTNQLSVETELLFADEPITITEEILKKHPEDLICMFASVYLRIKYHYDNPEIPALKIIENEFFQKNLLYFTNSITSVPEILEAVREAALQGLPEGSPFQKMKDTPYTCAAAAPILREISRDFHQTGDEQLALNQLRNAAMIEGIYGGTMTKEWCLELAEQCDRVQKDSLAGALARYAADVAHLEP